MALEDLPGSGDINFEITCPEVLHTWRNAIDNRSENDHDHSGTTPIAVLSIASSRAELPNGGRDGTLGNTTDDHKCNIWKDSTSTWKPVSVEPLILEIFD